MHPELRNIQASTGRDGKGQFKWQEKSHLAGTSRCKIFSKRSFSACTRYQFDERLRQQTVCKPWAYGNKIQFVH